jgi:hypothetical protein
MHGPIYCHEFMAAWLLNPNCHVSSVVTTAAESNMIQAANFWHQYVTCRVVRVTRMTGSISFGSPLGPCSLLPAPMSLLPFFDRFHYGIFLRGLTVYHFGFHFLLGWLLALQTCLHRLVADHRLFSSCPYGMNFGIQLLLDFTNCGSHSRLATLNFVSAASKAWCAS